MKAISFFHRTKLYLANSSWMMAERVFSMLLGFAITVLLARYLGPEKYGMLAYSLSLVSLFMIAGHMGLNGLAVRELVKFPGIKDETMGTVWILKAVGYIFGFLLLILFAFLTEEWRSDEFWILIILSLTLLLKPLDVIDFWFHSKVQAKYPSISKAIAVTITGFIKVAFVYAGAGILMFAVANVLQAFVLAVTLLIFYKFRSELSLSSWRVSFKRARELFKDGFLIFIGSILAVIYLKIDQVMLRWLGDGHIDVGIYAVAVTISEAWYFIPVAIVASFFPRLIKLRESDHKKYTCRLQQLFDLLFSIALVAAIITSLLAEPLIQLLFGNEYAGAGLILTIHIWAALFVFLRTAFSRWIIIEGMFLFSLITQGAGAITNVILNWYLIPVFGGVGAAVATLISYSSAAYLALLFSNKTRPIFWMMSLAMLSPVRYLIALRQLRNGAT